MEQGKVIILGGTPRSGKTTVANKLANKGFNVIHFDHIAEAIKTGLPEIKIDMWTPEICSVKLYSFFESLIKNLVDDAKASELNYIVDTWNFYPESIIKFPFQDDIKVYFLAYPNQAKEEIKSNIKQYSKKTDWIFQFLNDNDFLDMITEMYFNINQTLVNQCKEHGYELIDTSAGENRNFILNSLYDKILNTH